MKNLFVSISALLLANTSLAAGYQCTGTNEFDVPVQLNFTLTPTTLTLQSNFTQETEVLSRVADQAALAVYELEEKFDVEPGAYTLFTSVALPQAIAQGEHPGTLSFVATFRKAADGPDAHSNMTVQVTCRAFR